MKIHKTAIVDPSAKIADDVEIGPFAVIEADTEIGPGCRISAHAVIRQYTIMGSNNFVDCSSVIGGWPQDLKFNPEMVSHVKIGNGNRFREFVAINRATVENGATTVGDNTYWMNHAHAGHDVTVGNNVILPSNTQIGGHTRVDDGAILPANGNIHQFCWIGRKVMFQGGSQTSMHMPPYVICANVNNVVSINIVGLKRDPDISEEDIRQIKQAFSITYRKGNNMNEIVKQLDACEFDAAADEFRKFVKAVYKAEPPYKRGLCPKLSRIGARH